MAHVHPAIDDRLARFLAAQPVFFVATAPLAADGLVNLSPKGLAGTFAVLGPHRVAYLDVTGSGVETIAHLRENGRIVLMFCAFTGRPQIVRLHGRGVVHPAGSDGFAELAPHFADLPGARSIVDVEVSRVSDSCGMGVPRLRYEDDRDDLLKWATRKGPEGLSAYWEEKNSRSLDGLPGLAGVEPAES